MNPNEAIAKSADASALPRYEELGALAAGRMSMVFLARDSQDGQLVAIKRPHQGIERDARARLEFAREARFNAAVEHPNVVAVRALDLDAARPSFTMAFVEGASLLRMQTIERDGRALMSPVPTAVAVRIILDVLAGLHAVHEVRDGDATLGLLHGDLSPRNILIGIQGHSVLADFGTACPAGSPALPGSNAHRASPGYRAPETILGEPSTRSSDIFAAGVVLWEMFAGRRLFAAPTPQMVARQVVGGYIPELSAVAPNVPRRIAEACAKALSRDPAARPRTADDFRDTLLAATEESFGAVRHEAVAIYLKTRCSAVIEQVRELIVPRSTPRTESGFRPRTYTR